MSKRLATKILNTGLVPPPEKHITALAATTKRAKGTAPIRHPAMTAKSAAAPPEGRKPLPHLGLTVYCCTPAMNAALTIYQAVLSYL